MATDTAMAANSTDGFFTDTLQERDPEVFATVMDELSRQRDEIELIASENIVSKAVLETAGSVLTNKYAEGYPNRRYYGGCVHVDVIEELAIERATKLFGCQFANVQPHSGSQANQAVFLALMQPGDTFMGLDLNAGGHLTHGSKVNMSGKWFHVEPYGVRRQDSIIDMDEVAAIARRVKPKVILAGGSAYGRFWDFARFREIADEVGAYLLVDMAHFAGLVGWESASQSVSACPCCDDNHTQDASWATRRDDTDQRRGVGEEDQLGCVPRTPGRPADAHHSG